MCCESVLGHYWVCLAFHFCPVRKKTFICQVLWNEELVQKVVARAYTKLLKQLLKETKCAAIDATTWYTFLPNLSITTGRWKQMATKVWHDLLTLTIISSEVGLSLVTAVVEE